MKIKRINLKKILGIKLKGSGNATKKEGWDSIIEKWGLLEKQCELIVFLICLLMFYLILCVPIKKFKAITIECQLLSRDINVATFDCGKYGILFSDDQEIFRKAKENSKLNVYFGRECVFFGKKGYEIYKILDK